MHDAWHLKEFEPYSKKVTLLETTVSDYFEVGYINMTYFSVLQLHPNTVTIISTKGAIITLLHFNLIFVSLLVKNI